MKALVTGCAGFVGRHMAAELIERGYDVVGVDTDGSGVLKKGRTFIMDVRHFFESPDSRTDWDLVVHCAAVVGGRTMIDGAPLLLAAEDLSIDAGLFRWLLARPSPPKVVYYSSSAAYPVYQQAAPFGDLVRSGRLDADDLRLTEDVIDLDEPELPDATYGWVKLTGERLAHEARTMGLPVYVFRPFSGYGTDQALDYPFPTFIDRARRRLDPFPVWGTGTQVRDFVHIDDVVAATMARLDSEDTSPVNIATGRATSFLDLADLVAAAVNDLDPDAGYQPIIAPNPAAPVGVDWRVGSTEKLSRFYQPTVDLETGIARALAPMM